MRSIIAVAARMFFAGAVCLSSLLGCSTKQSPLLTSASPLWTQHLAVLEGMDQWAFQGRIAVKDGTDSWSMKLNWAQTNEHFDIRIIAPFGQGAAHLYGNGEFAVIDVPERPQMSAPSAEELLRHHIGWTVPLEGLKYWLAGRPDPDLMMSGEWDALGRLNQLTQSGWYITYKRYSTVAGIDLPRKIELINDQLRVKLVIDRWQLDS